ncbi:MAG: LysR family transcriptional regulator [Desulfobacula sp.]|jgi:DNA-binding transcriptional LysR family regulator|uniref:selenium metabolism-associated LysR family transcriptional regulator n=1 Tax=Desulfobacula sp. TaxID=2593537 RepID=UPI001D2EF270|nr:LysR family transcriptional regulator [Desulfobacula sp.]MBT3483904.1 LysR family transcriptional regulator [Desulfobacula sp.]MBT3803909.1 LysR family transcriptional regulator [Desulfobacula sp.]MBT4023854.1 LysR family transcriptional regulator [Desulfobacula sp.]MBT4197586.1 LysR family transcriptional regulator [Desulfobacula sp.]
MAIIDFTFYELETFCKVVELESFSKAAKATFLAQASVSGRIASLEQKIGVQLLDRLGRKVIPSAAGELLYKHAILLLEMKKTARLEFESFLGMEQGAILIGGSTIPGEYILPGLIGKFHRQYPKISVNLTIADTSKIKNRVLSGELEIGVVGSKSPHPSLLAHKLWEDELVLAVPNRHPWARRRTISLQELRTTPFILREEGSGTLKTLDSFLHAAGIEGTNALQVAARFSSSTAIKEGIKSGLGLSILSSKAIDTELNAGLLKSLKVKGLSMNRSFFLIRNKLRIASPSCQAILEFLLATAGDQKI